MYPKSTVLDFMLRRHQDKQVQRNFETQGNESLACFTAIVTAGITTVCHTSGCTGGGGGNISR